MDEPQPTTTRRPSKPVSLYSPPGSAAAGRVDYSLKEHAMRGTKVLETARIARRELELSTPDLLGSKGNVWNPSNTMDFKDASKHSTKHSGLALSNSLSPSALNDKDMRTSRVFNALPPSPHRSTTMFNRDLPEWSDWKAGRNGTWNGSTMAPDERQMRKTLEEQTSRSHNHSLKVTSRSFGGLESSYISPIRRQELIIGAVRALKMTPPDEYEGLDRGLIEKYGVEGARHMVFVQELSMKQQQREEQLMTMLIESGGKLPSSPVRRGMRASRDDLTSVTSLPPDATLTIAVPSLAGTEDKEADERRAGGTRSSGGLPLPPWRKI